MNKALMISLIFCSALFAKKKESIPLYLDSLTNTIVTRLASNPSGGMVILPFADQSGKELGKQVEEYVYQSCINSGKLTVVDRTQIQTIMAEMDLQGMISSEDQFKVGAMAAAKYLMTGTVNKGFNETYMISLKVISVETSSIVAGSSVNIPILLFETPSKKK